MTCTGNRKNGDRGLQNIYYLILKIFLIYLFHITYPSYLIMCILVTIKRNINHQFYLVIKSRKHHEGT